MSYAWARYSTLPATVRWLYLAYGNDHFVALQSGTAIVASSADGFTWTLSSMASATFWASLGYGLHLGVPTFMAFTLGGGCQISTDNGLTWTAISGLPGLTTGESIRQIAYGNDVFVVVTHLGNIYWSGDLSSSWNGPIAIAVAATPNYQALTFGNGFFITATRSGTLEYATSTDGNTWSTGLTPPNSIEDFAVGNGLIMAVSGGLIGEAFTTVDGITWSSSVTLPAPSYISLAFGANTWVAIPRNTMTSAVSTDNGATWTAVAFPADVLGEFGRVVRFGETNLFVALLDLTPGGSQEYLILEVTPPDDGGGGGGDDGEDAEPSSGGIGGGPVNQTWLYDGSTGFWSKLKSFGIDRHRVQFSFQLAGMTIGADYANGKLYRITDTALSDNGQAIEGEIIGETLANPDEAALTVNKLRVVMETGTGNTVDPGSNPQVSISISRDNGHTWGAEMWKPLGAIGAYHTRLEWRRLGTTRYFTAKLRITDPVKRVITSASVNPDN